MCSKYHFRSSFLSRILIQSLVRLNAISDTEHQKRQKLCNKQLCLLKPNNMDFVCISTASSEWSVEKLQQQLPRIMNVLLPRGGFKFGAETVVERRHDRSKDNCSLTVNKGIVLISSNKDTIAIVVSHIIESAYFCLKLM